MPYKRTLSPPKASSASDLTFNSAVEDAALCSMLCSDSQSALMEIKFTLERHQLLKARVDLSRYQLPPSEDIRRGLEGHGSCGPAVRGPAVQQGPQHAPRLRGQVPVPEIHLEREIPQVRPQICVRHCLTENSTQE